MSEPRSFCLQLNGFSIEFSTGLLHFACNCTCEGLSNRNSGTLQNLQDLLVTIILCRKKLFFVFIVCSFSFRDLELHKSVNKCLYIRKMENILNMRKESCCLFRSSSGLWRCGKKDEIEYFHGRSSEIADLFSVCCHFVFLCLWAWINWIIFCINIFLIITDKHRNMFERFIKKNEVILGESNHFISLWTRNTNRKRSSRLWPNRECARWSCTKQIRSSDSWHNSSCHVWKPP